MFAYGLKWKLVRQIITAALEDSHKSPATNVLRPRLSRIQVQYEYKKSFLLIAALHEPDEPRQKHTTLLGVKLQNLIRMSLVLTH